MPTNLPTKSAYQYMPTICLPMYVYNTLATCCKELIHWKRPWCWERLKAGREGDNRGWDGWMASLTWWTWVWVNSGRWWWTGKPGVLQSMRSQRVGHNWAIELNWRRMPGIWQVVDKALIELSPLPNIFGVQCSQLEKITVNKMNYINPAQSKRTWPLS